MKKKHHHKIKKYGRDVLKSENFLKSAEFMQHGTISVKEHSVRVAGASLRAAEFFEKFNIKCDEQALVRGALLHDYFLYDWHEKDLWHNWHGFRHAKTALKNAETEYDLTPIEKDIIEKHMFPLNFKPPVCREAWIVNIADTYCSFQETVFTRNGNSKKSDIDEITKKQAKRRRYHEQRSKRKLNRIQQP